MAAIRSPLPEVYLGQSGILPIRSEEEGTIWLWAYPSLLEWPREIVWIDSPVVGNDRWPGDLWGVDQDGELLMVETKRGQTCDPFEDFVRFHSPGRIETTSEELLERWKLHYQAELSFSSALVKRPPRRTAGLLPRSNQRAHIRRWPYLAGLIDAQVRGIEYRQKVARHLTRREERGNPTPYYIGVLVQTRLRTPNLSRKGRDSATALRHLVGADRVLLYAAGAEVVAEDEVKIITLRLSTPGS